MAKKSADTTKDAATATKAGAKAGVKKTAVKKASKPKAETASKSGTPKASATKKSSPKAASPKADAKKPAVKKAAGPKLNDRQVEFLKRIKDAGEPGYAVGPKIEQRTVDVLHGHKLLKRGAKNKETGQHHYMLTKLGEKHSGSHGTSSPSTGS